MQLQLMNMLTLSIQLSSVKLTIVTTLETLLGPATVEHADFSIQLSCV